MSIENNLLERSGHKCEICESTNGLGVYYVSEEEREEQAALLCEACRDQIENPDHIDPNHWRSLNSAMWSEQDSIKIISYHMLHVLESEAWARELLEQIYLEEDVLLEAKSYHQKMGGEKDGEFALDSNGAKLFQGDSVTLIKDLDVKGANFTAKRGTMVKNISLTGDTANIEGKINGTQIVLKTIFLKKA